MRSEPQRTVTGPLRVLLVLEASSAGAGQHVLNLAQGLVDQGHEVHLAWSMLRTEIRFLRQLKELERNGLRSIQVLMRPEPGLLDLGAIISVIHYMRFAGPFDIVHGHSAKGGAVARLAAWLTGSARLYTPHAFITQNPLLRKRARWFYRAIELFLGYFTTDGFVLTSRDEAAHARGLGLPRARLHVIPNVVQPPPNILSRDEARRSFGLPPDVPVVTWIGRMTSQKAPGRFVEVMKILRQHLPDVRAIMLGHGDLERELRSQIEASGLGTCVRLYNDRRGWDALAAADLCVLTSRYEGMALVPLEARALNVPVVATDVSGVVEALGDCPRSRIVPSTDNGRELAEAASFVLRSISPRAETRTTTNSPMFRFIESHVELYSRVLTRKGPRSWTPAPVTPQATVLSMTGITDTFLPGPEQSPDRARSEVEAA